MKTEDMIYDQLKEIRSDVKYIKENVDKNTVDLEHHIKRTDLLEKHAVMVNWKSVAMFFGILASIATMVVGVMRLISM